MTAFYNTPLGELYRAIPFDLLSKQVPVPRRSISDKGCQPWFDVKGGDRPSNIWHHQKDERAAMEVALWQTVHCS